MADQAADGVIEVRPASADRWPDVEAVLAPRDPDAPACWCLSYRLPNAENRGLAGRARGARLRQYAVEGRPPGVIAYVDGTPAGWCSVAPRRLHHRLTHSRTIPVVDDVDVWSVICFVVRVGYRRQGLAHQLLDGAIAYARSEGAPALEGYPVEPEGERLDTAFAYVGTTGLFAAHGFQTVLPTTSHTDHKLRWVMRLDLR
ncbi:N-acetyltransferase [Microlunatus endophyticus]|uniref:N-acetyltransferase n=1 Tax=Microlunatus endophyticus TaxID=1716077 RepID=A0A917S8V6_9ACTN|nr:GNAT family N-acetyltransferase [Microlunatus endophyticus]GGL62870.1 N-acetyltransferase [Microlunatus endophyticus]